MNTRLSLVVFAALLGLFASQALAADYCLGIPFTVKEKYCGGPIPCTLGEYCDRTSTCVPTKALGAACEEDYECSLGSFCRGPEDAKVCVAISGVGQPCTGDSSIAQADCSPYLACNQTSKKCFNGAFGDACTANADCRSGVCTGGNCDGPVGVDCNPFGTDLVCSPANYCSMIDGQCVARLAVGASCTGSSCVSTAACARSVDGNNQNRTCIAKSTVAAGGFCDGTSELCASGICYNNYCLAKPPTYCSNNGVQCSGNQMCLCGKDFLYNGYGKCASYKCMDKFTALMTCAMTQCKTDGLQTISYPNSCLSLHCKAEFDDALACNGLLLSMIGFGNGGGGDPTL